MYECEAVLRRKIRQGRYLDAKVPLLHALAILDATCAALSATTIVIGVPPVPAVPVVVNSNVTVVMSSPMVKRSASVPPTTKR
jgi:hypothetical protein